MLVKRLLLLPVIVVMAWMVMACLVVDRANTHNRTEELIEGSIGEPDNLNPIIASTTSASEIDDFVFNGLVKYDEHVNIVGDLAESFHLTQDSTAFYPSAEAAGAALGKLNAAQARWGAMKLRAARQESERLLLHFEDPKENVAGVGYQDVLFTLLDRASMVPAATVTVAFDPEAKGSDAKPLGIDGVRKLLDGLAAKDGLRIAEAMPIGDSLLGLVVVGPSGKFIQEIPTALKQAECKVMDNLDQTLLNEPVVTFQIRPGVKWHDGEPLTSADAAFLYRSVLDPQYLSPRSSDFWPVKSVATPDERTFVVRYRYPYTDSLISWMMQLLPRHILEGRNAQWWADHYNFKPIGTGPFRLVEWKRNEFLRLEAFKDYFEGPPNLPAVVYRILPDPFVNQVAFDARELDVNDLQPYQVNRYEEDKDFKTFNRWGRGYEYIGWNLTKPLFADRKVRQALAHAVNIDRIIKYIYRGYAKQANGIFPFQMYYADKDLAPLAYDPDLARKMLAEAGWKDTDGDGILDKDGQKFQFTLITNNGSTVRQSIQMLVQDDLKKIGVHVETATYEWAVFIKNYVDSRQFDACVLGWQLTYSPDQYQLWHSSQADPPGLDFVSYRNPRADELMVRIRTSFDRQEITRLAHELQKTIYDDQPYLFVAYALGNYAMYRGKYVVRRPDGKGGWIVEPVRNTDLGFAYYLPWWAPRSAGPQLKP